MNARGGRRKREKKSETQKKCSFEIGKNGMNCVHMCVRARPFDSDTEKSQECLCLVVTQQQIAISHNNHACTCDKCAEEGNIGTAVFIVSWQAQITETDNCRVVGAHRSF